MNVHVSSPHGPTAASRLPFGLYGPHERERERERRRRRILSEKAAVTRRGPHPLLMVKQILDVFQINLLVALSLWLVGTIHWQ